MRNREELEKHLEAILAPYAMRSAASRGRRHVENEAPYRGLFQRDRDRIVHSAAFRRLEHKTQVFVRLENDHFRNRLTHTMEVSQIARSSARALSLNEDLVEALALAHDLGHGPFGHAGEDALDEMMRGHGGFNHNLHGLRLVDHLEIRYPDFQGINLTYETREGFSKNLSAQQRAAAGFAERESASLEVQLVGHADEIAYDTHDLEDGLSSGTLDEPALHELTLWRKTEEEVTNEFKVLTEDRLLRWRAVCRRLIRKLVSDLVAETERRVKAQRVETLDDVRLCPHELVGFSTELQPLKRQLEGYLFRNFYSHPNVKGPAQLWQSRLKQLFAAYRMNVRLLPDEYFRRVDAGEEKPERAICDYLAGMTDRFAEKQWERWCTAP